MKNKEDKKNERGSDWQYQNKLANCLIYDDEKDMQHVVKIEEVSLLVAMRAYTCVSQ